MANTANTRKQSKSKPSKTQRTASRPGPQRKVSVQMKRKPSLASGKDLKSVSSKQLVVHNSSRPSGRTNHHHAIAAHLNHLHLHHSVPRQLAMAVMLPELYSTRLNDGYDVTPSTTANPFSIEQIDVSEPFPDPLPVGWTTPYLAAGTWFAAYSRNPLCHSVVYENNYAMKPIRYIAYFSTLALTGAPAITIDPHTITLSTSFALGTQTYSGGVPISGYPLNTAVSWHLPIAYLLDDRSGDNGHAHPHAGKLMAICSKHNSQEKFVWIDSMLTILVKAYGVSGAVDFSGVLTVNRWAGDTSVPFTTVTQALGSAVELTLTVAGYYSFQYSGGVDNAGAQKVIALSMFLGSNGEVLETASPMGNTCFLSHRAAPGFLAKSNFAQIRLIGSACRLTPDCAAISEGGRCAAIQLSSAYMVEGLAQLTTSGPSNGAEPTTAIMGMRGAFTQDFKQGMYSYAKLTSEEDLEYMRPFQYSKVFRPGIGNLSGNSLMGYENYFECPGGWVVNAVATPTSLGISASSNLAHPAGLFHVTFNLAAQFQTQDVWWGASLPPPTTAEDFREAMQIVAYAPQFTENFIHLSTLKNWYNKASAALSPIAGVTNTILKALSVPFPWLRPASVAVDAVKTALPAHIG